MAPQVNPGSAAGSAVLEGPELQVYEDWVISRLQLLVGLLGLLGLLLVVLGL